MSFNSLPNNKFLHWSNFKAFADNKINVSEKVKYVLGRLENLVGIGENAGNQHYFLQRFQKDSFFNVFNPLLDMPILSFSSSAAKIWCQKYGQTGIQLSDD